MIYRECERAEYPLFFSHLDLNTSCFTTPWQARGYEQKLISDQTKSRTYDVRIFYTNLLSERKVLILKSLQRLTSYRFAFSWLFYNLIRIEIEKFVETFWCQKPDFMVVCAYVLDLHLGESQRHFDLLILGLLFLLEGFLMIFQIKEVFFWHGWITLKC